MCSTEPWFSLDWTCPTSLQIGKRITSPPPPPPPTSAHPIQHTEKKRLARKITSPPPSPFNPKKKEKKKERCLPRTLFNTERKKDDEERKITHTPHLTPTPPPFNTQRGKKPRKEDYTTPSQPPNSMKTVTINFCWPESSHHLLKTCTESLLADPGNNKNSFRCILRLVLGLKVQLR